MEWSEIGYRNGSFKPISNIGLTGMSPDSYIRDIHQSVPEARLVVIAHPHNINADDIYAVKMNGVSLLSGCNLNSVKPILITGSPTLSFIMSRF
ncbi:hypothetical protein B738_09541 [Photorhabdus temperata subsp. temperata M1021]|nr:hypothetical protein B738_09541 [Photorhabdus temperata subsp. temperata M1021]